MTALPYLPLFLACLFCGSSASLAAADIERALDFAKRTENKVYREKVKPHWLTDGKSFWYKVQTGPGASEFVMVEAATGLRKTARDLGALGLPAEEVKTSRMEVELRPTRHTGEGMTIRFVNQWQDSVELFWINPQEKQIRMGSVPNGESREFKTYEGHVWLIKEENGKPLGVTEAAVTAQTIIIDGRGAPTEGSKRASGDGKARSPNGKYAASIEKGTVMLRTLDTGAATPLMTGLEAASPLRGEVQWSPDSSAFVVSACADISKRMVSIVESSPIDQLQPKVSDFEYAKPGDALPKPFPVVLRPTAEGFAWTRVNNDQFPNHFTTQMRVPVRWGPDGREIYFDYNERGHQRYGILAADANTGATRMVVEETSKTFIDYTKKTWRHWLDSSGELLWMSERTGWCHLWLYDVRTGALKNQVTSGEWPVREVLYVDEKRREIWFLASGLRPGEDPYHEHLCRVNIDGTGFVRLTEADGQHEIEFSPGRQFFIAAWSRADHPPVTELRRSRDGGLVCVLEKTEISDLLAAGWSLPERFIAKGRDEKTEIHGVIIKPSTFDPNRSYPVVEEIYAGPHSAFSPKTFGRLVRQHQIAELGFVVVQMDGMGTNHRGKAFHDVCWKNLKDAGFPDRIAWIKAAAATRPWMDLGRVGIYGGSAGGQSAMRALIDHHDFYKVAVADCGCHDNRMDKIWWNEQWMGWPVDESYARNSNTEDAAKLEGQLLLIVGELDKNVDPASTLQVVGALQRAKKSFEFMPIIGAGHSAAETPYGSRLRMEFLVKHLKP